MERTGSIDDNRRDIVTWRDFGTDGDLRQDSPWMEFDKRFPAMTH